MLSKEDRKKFENKFSKGNVVGGIARLYRTQENVWYFTELYGVVCTFQKDYTLHVALYDFNSLDTLFEHECLLKFLVVYFFFLVYRGFNFHLENKTFLSFEGDYGGFGFLFCDEKDASNFQLQANKLMPLQSLQGTGSF
jgi:hypothetical protein